MLNGIEFKEQRAELIKMGDKAFPAYRIIITDPLSMPQHVRRALHVIANVPGDRSQFVEPSVQRLADTVWEVRISAVRLLGRIGSSRDAAPVVALLADDRLEVVYAAAETLAAIGDRRTLAAMDVWLNSGNRRDDKLMMDHVKKCRDELKKRLDKEKLEKEKPPGK